MIRKLKRKNSTPIELHTYSKTQRTHYCEWKELSTQRWLSVFSNESFSFWFFSQFVIAIGNNNLNMYDLELHVSRTVCDVICPFRNRYIWSNEYYSYVKHSSKYLFMFFSFSDRQQLFLPTIIVFLRGCLCKMKTA